MSPTATKTRQDVPIHHKPDASQQTSAEQDWSPSIDSIVPAAASSCAERPTVQLCTHIMRLWVAERERKIQTRDPLRLGFQLAQVQHSSPPSQGAFVSSIAEPLSPQNQHASHSRCRPARQPQFQQASCMPPSFVSAPWTFRSSTKPPRRLLKSTPDRY